MRAQSIETIENMPKMLELGGTTDKRFHAHSHITLSIMEGLSFYPGDSRDTLCACQRGTGRQLMQLVDHFYK